MAVMVDPVQWATEITRKIRDEISQIKTIGFAEVKTVAQKSGGGYTATVLLPGATVATKDLNCINTYKPTVGDWATLVYPPGADPVLIGASPVAGSSPEFVDPDQFLKHDGTQAMTGDLNLNNSVLMAHKLDDTNMDHIWHDDTNNAWNFVSDGARKSAGNSKLVAGAADISGTVEAGNVTVKANDAALILDEREVSGGKMYRISSANGRIEVGYWDGTTWQYNPIMIHPETSSITVNNLESVDYIRGQYGDMLQSTDEWLRVNGVESHSNGIYCGTSVLRTDGEIQLGNAGASFKATSSVLRAFGDYVMVGITGSVQLTYSAATRLQADISFSFPKTPRVTATLRWVSGNTSLDIIGALYVENVTATGARISVVNDKGAASSFISSSTIWVDWHACYIM